MATRRTATGDSDNEDLKRERYYEFAAVDRPPTGQQQAELRSRSTRATITASSFLNEYHWGDLKGDPLDWVERYFDALVYSANRAAAGFFCDCHGQY
jgi:hypothetical protein